MNKRIQQRRISDKKIEDVESKFLTKCSEVTCSIDGLTMAIKDIQNILKDYNESGLPIMIKDFNERKIFAERTEGYAKNIIFISKVAGALTIIAGTAAAIIYLVNNGHFPSTKS